MIFDQKFLDALKDFPPDGKDNLIIFLLKKHPNIAKQLRYELVEEPEKEKMKTD